MVSGSAALPVPQMDEWLDISDHVLLERYGMTEILMALSNPYRPIDQRLRGCVGKPLPGVETALLSFDEEGNGDRHILESGEPIQGELIIRSTSLFNRYLNKPEVTAKEFWTDPQGQRWFFTGDCAERDQNGVYSIKGRLSADIIKKGGYKISALDIEAIVLEHPAVKEVCVFGLPDEKYGEEIVALVVEAGNKGTLKHEEVQAFCREKLSSYKVPRIWKTLE